MLVSKIRAIEKERVQIPYAEDMDSNYRRLKYVRYADDFLIGVIGSLDDCRRIKEDVKNFLNDKLMLELSKEKPLITHSETAAKFLSYEVNVKKSNLTKRGPKLGRLEKIYNKRVVLKMPDYKFRW